MNVSSRGGDITISKLGLHSSNSSQDLHINAPLFPNDSWRRTRTLLAKRRHETILDISPVLTIPDQARWTTTIGSCQAAPYIAIGSAAKTNNLFIVENTARNKIVPADDKNIPQRLNLKSAFTAPHPIYHISITGDKLATAGPSGYVQIFQVDFNELSIKGRGLAHLTECSMGENKVEWLPLSPPGTTIGTVRIQHVEFEPTGIAPNAAAGTPHGGNPTKLMAVQGKRLFIWDLESEKVLVDETISNDTMPVATYSPHAPHGSLVACASTDRNIYLTDTRLMMSNIPEPGNKSNRVGSGVVWKIEHAHQGVVNSIQFNPFIPYWLASAGEDGTAKVWDIRFLRNPVARVDGHFGGINSISWSNVRCDVFSTASSDQSLRSWMLSPNTNTPKDISFDTYFIGCPESGFHTKSSRSKDAVLVGANLIAETSHDYFNAPIVSVCAALTHADSFYALSSIGELMSVTLRDELFDQLAPHRYDSLRSPREHEIESSIYSRDLAEAYRGVISLSKAARTDGKMVADNEAELIDLCTARTNIDPESWSIPPPDADGFRLGSREMVERMKSELDNFTYYLPPGFSSEFPQWITAVPTKLRLELEMVVLRFNILIDVAKGLFENILKAEKKICTGMENDSTFMDGDTLKLLVETVIPNEYIKGMQMGLRFCEIVEDTPSKKFLEVFDTVHLLLFPTVYERERWLPDVDTTLVPMKQRSTVLKSSKLKDWIEQRRTEAPSSTTNNKEALSNAPLMAKKPGDRSSAPSGEVDKKSNGSMTTMDSGAKKMLLERFFTDPKVALKMVRMEIQLQKLLAKGGDSLDEDIIKLMTSIDSRPGQSDKVSKHREITVSSHANRLYLDSLLNLGKFEDFFISSLELIASYPNTDFMKMILRLCERDALPKLKNYVDDYHNKSSAQLRTAIQAGQQHPLPARKDGPDTATPVLTDSLTSTIKTFKDAMQQIAAIGLTFATAVDAKVTGPDEFFLDCIERIVLVLTGLMAQLMVSLTKTVDAMEDILTKLPSPQAIVLKLSSMQYQMVKDALIDSTKTWPSSQKSAALALAQLRDPHANFPRVMLPLHDEINKIVQRLEKVISVKNGEA